MGIINVGDGMEEENKFPKRKRNRLENYDYSTSGAYFITVCTKDRKNIFWCENQPCFVGEAISLPSYNEILSPYGEIVDKAINEIPKHYSHIKLLKYVIMPNHIHMILFIPYDNGRIISSPTSILTAVGQMKRYVSKEIGDTIWQRSFHDHIIRDYDEYEKISKYVSENPLYWQYDCFYTE